MTGAEPIPVVLGVGGGIAAYKAAELARCLVKDNCRVQTVMTAAAKEFITPLTFAALTANKVITDLFSDRSAGDILASAVEHIEVARTHRMLIVAPATADLLAKFAHGLAGDFLSTFYLAFEGEVVLCPAMNSAMWAHPATVENLAKLAARPRHHIIPPEEGELACGTAGPGRLPEPEAIAAKVHRILHQKHDLDGETLLITAGPTREPLDPVRFISNRSSGKMGYAIAEAAAERGARVILVSGPVHIPAPEGVELVETETAIQMHDAVMDRVKEASIIIKAAAVADYHVTNIPTQKVKKTAMRLSLELDPTPDILAELGRVKGDQILIGFAAETQNMVDEARRKLKTKNCDMVVANLVNQDGTGFESDDNEVALVPANGEVVRLGKAPKRVLADQILDRVLGLRLEQHARGR